MDYQELKKQLDDFEKKARENFPLKKGDNVYYLKRRNGDAETWDYGWIEYVWFDEKRGVVYTSIKNRMQRAFMAYSDKSTCYVEDIGKTVKKVNNPVTSEMAQELEEKLYEIEDDKSLARFEYEKKKEEIKKEITELRSKCIHRWKQGDFVETKPGDWLNSEHEVYEFICEICGMVAND